ncbi:type II toxin-antitoxin system RelE/ParE family toxin [Candidatus Pacearchaeota archaeon]|nr:type II toxin-antitoxin system RelE/ParE family toxin [Candidatus Pacearchaeota archaeon]
MVNVIFSDRFKRKFKKSDESLKIKIRKQIKKVIEMPDIGKPMRYNRKGTREIYLGSFRLSYSFSPKEDTITFLNIYHKNEQ